MFVREWLSNVNVRQNKRQEKNQIKAKHLFLFDKSKILVICNNENVNSEVKWTQRTRVIRKTEGGEKYVQRRNDIQLTHALVIPKIAHASSEFVKEGRIYYLLKRNTLLRCSEMIQRHAGKF